MSSSPVFDALDATLKIGARGLSAQSLRLRVVAENIANSQSTAATPIEDPYRRKTVTFVNELDRVSGLHLLHVKKIGLDTRPFRLEHDPDNPAADAQGNVKMPNVNILTEMGDMREASKTYEAILQAVKQAKDMSRDTVDLLKS